MWYYLCIAVLKDLHTIKAVAIICNNSTYPANIRQFLFKNKR